MSMEAEDTMMNWDQPESVREFLDRGVSGLNARPDMRAHIMNAQRAPKRRRSLVPAAAAVMAALLLAIGIGTFINTRSVEDEFYILEAGGTVQVTAKPVTVNPSFTVAEGENVEHAVLILNGDLYRMTRFLPNAGNLLGGAVGTVGTYSETPFTQGANKDGISNAILPGDKIYAVQNLAISTAVIAEVDGQLALFQRTGEHGFGLNGDSFEGTCAVRGQLASLEIEGIGELNGDLAERAMTCLMETARLEGAEAMPGEQLVHIRLKNGLQLELTISGDQLIGCGVWDCTEFLDLFRDLVANHYVDRANA